MAKRRILMCLEQLNIGGVETAVITLCQGYLRAGHQVFVAAKSGIYTKTLKDLGIEVLNIEYEIDNMVHLEKREELIRFCQTRKITEVHIHQYPCIMYWLPVCMELNIPYVAYSHSIVPGAIEWITGEFPTYNAIIPLFYENASKIICIAESTKQEIEDRYHLGDDKYLIIPNSLNMANFSATPVPKKITIFGIAARLSDEKLLSLEKSVDLFAEYATTNENTKLLIAGSGPQKRKLEKYISSKKLTKKVNFLGNVTDMPSFYNKIDVFMGVDRCVLEALACKKVVFICSYTGSIHLITKDNIELASKQNFSGMNLPTTESAFTKLENITEKDYKTITTNNYKFINKKYSVDNNLYRGELTTNYTKDYNYIFETCNNYALNLEKLNKRRPSVIIKRILKSIRKILSKIKHAIIKE